MSRALLPLSLACVLVSCGGSERKSQAAMHEDGVPANSLSDKRLYGDGKSEGDEKKDDQSEKKRTENTATARATTQSDPTQPYLTPVANRYVATTKSDSVNAGLAGAKKTGQVTKAECGQLFDRYVELAIGADSRLEGLPPELIQQAKAQARQQKGDPCETEVVPRAKYTCAMAATSPAQWQRCMN